MNSFFNALRDQFSYLLSLPERTVRSLAAVAGGTTTLLTDTLFPDSLRGTTMYRIFVGDTQKFVIEKVAQIQKEAGDAEGEPTDPKYMQKKMIGGALETAGLFAMHFSPLWVFAIAGDAAAGSNTFFNRLVDHLKANGVLEPDANVSNITDVLESMQDTARRSASAIDTPPLSREELAKLAEDMSVSYGQMFAKSTNLIPRFETLWNQMSRVASKENVSFERLSGVLTVDAAAWGKKSVGAVFAVGQTGADLFGEKILDSYARTLNAVSDEGVTGYLDSRLSPFLKAAADHFDPNRKTWTEQFLGSGGKKDCEPPTAVQDIVPTPPPVDDQSSPPQQVP